MLSAEHLSFHFPDGRGVISDVSVSVAPGEMIAVLGENASGKSTLLKLLAGMLQPSSGKVTVDGQPLTHARDRVGLVFQNPDHQMIAPTVEEEIALGLELRGIPVAEMRPRIDQMLQHFDLSPLRFVSPSTLSGGQKQRVALAAIMVIQPHFLLFDEPDSLLDAPSRADLLNAVAVVRESCGIIWTSPHPKRIPAVDRVFELTQGTLRAREAMPARA